MFELVARAKQVFEHIVQETGRDPAIAEIVERLDVSPGSVALLTKTLSSTIGRYTTVSIDAEAVSERPIKELSVPAAEEGEVDALELEKMRILLDAIDGRESDVLRLRYGLIDGETKTLSEVGRRMGLTKERVRQLEAQALAKLRGVLSQAGATTIIKSIKKVSPRTVRVERGADEGGTAATEIVPQRKRGGPSETEPSPGGKKK